MIDLLQDFYTRNTNPKFWRDLSELDTCNYNCGSYALDLLEWFSPYDNGERTYHERIDTMLTLRGEGYSVDEIKDIIVDEDIEEILRVCPWLEVVELEDCQKEDTIIAYRVAIMDGALDDEYEDVYDKNYGVDEDFHFRKRLFGTWFEKCGECPVVRCEEQDVEIPWNSLPYMKYDSKIIYFRELRKI